jgi:CheY-like chemotaxis protein
MKKTVVAIFDDDKVDRFVYRKLFRGFEDQIEVYLFDNPEKGIAASASITFDVVFIDLHFWDNFGGINILNKLNKVAQSKFIAVAMTSLLQEGDLETVIGAGFSMCIEKPVNFTTIFPLQKKSGSGSQAS